MGNLRHRIFGEPFVEMHDWKVSRFDGRAVASGFLSIRDRALEDPRLVDYLEGEFGSHCRYEGDCCRAAQEMRTTP